MKTPAQLLVFDFETYYDKDYSLSKMSTLDYLMDKQFQPICVSIKADNKAPVCIKGDGTSVPKAMVEALMDLGWERSLVVAHHNRFDSGIAMLRFKMPPPAMFGCTRLMARAIVRPYAGSVTLKKVAEYYRLGEKGSQRETYLGYRLGDFSASQLADYMAYCNNDTDLCHGIFGQMLKYPFPPTEMANIDIVLRMYLQPVLRLNADVLEGHLACVRQAKRELLENLPGGVGKDELMSNPKFAKVLTALGAEIPMKTSPTTGKETFAFAKTDPGFKELGESDSPEIQAVCAARTGVKSTIEETRTERMLDIAKRYGALCVPLVYAGAHTLRYSGDEKINMQNPPRGSLIRKAMEAPYKHDVVVADYAQIEARIAAALAKCDHLLDAFRDPDRDPYAEQATRSFGVPVTKATEPQKRWVGKVEVLQLQYASGWKKLQATLARGEGSMPGIVVSDKRAKELTYGYREGNWQIPKLWSDLEGAMVRMSRKESFDLVGGCEVLLGMVKLPNGLIMPYRNLRFEPRTGREGEWVYDFGRLTRKLYGGKFLENLCQALAALLIREAMVRLHRRGLRAVLQVHDDITMVTPTKHRERVVEIIREEMLKVPPWLPTLPLEVEIGIGPNYLDAK